MRSTNSPVTQGGASLALGYYLSPLRGFPLGSLHSLATLALSHAGPMTQDDP